MPLYHHVFPPHAGQCSTDAWTERRRDGGFRRDDTKQAYQHPVHRVHALRWQCLGKTKDGPYRSPRAQAAWEGTAVKLEIAGPCLGLDHSTCGAQPICLFLSQAVDSDWCAPRQISYREMLQRVEDAFPGKLERLSDPKSEVAKNFRLKGFVGSVSFITSMTADFCSDCNRFVNAARRVRIASCPSSELQCLSSASIL